jgi:uncharacterized Zn finger protein
MPDFEPVFSPLVAAIIECPKCPRCQRYRMLIPKREQGPVGFCTLKCRKCGHVSTIVDPMASGARGWLASELRPPT